MPGLGRSPRKGNGNPHQQPCLKNSTNRGAMASYSTWGSHRVGHDLVTKTFNINSSPKERQCQRMFNLPHNCTHFTRSQVQFSHSVVSDSLRPNGLQHARLPYPSPTPRACLNSCPSTWWCHSTISYSTSPSIPAFNLSQHQGLFQGVRLSHQVAKILELQLQHLSFQWIFRTDFL